VTQLGDEWEARFDRFLEPFLEAWRHKTRRRWAPLYLRGLLLPGERKSIEPLAERVAPGHKQELRHFVSESDWNDDALEAVLLDKADAMVGGPDSVLIIDDTALPKKGTESVGVAHQYCGAQGKQANCQSLVSLTLAKDDVPVPLSLPLYLPESWASDRKRREKEPPRSPGSRGARARRHHRISRILGTTHCSAAFHVRSASRRSRN
jgi:SRSO17 transposase